VFYGHKFSFIVCRNIGLERNCRCVEICAEVCAVWKRHAISFVLLHFKHRFIQVVQLTKAQIPLRRLSRESRGDKLSRHVESVTSSRQTRLCRSNGIGFVTMHRESRRQS